jgi:hypothetical protein
MCVGRVSQVRTASQLLLYGSLFFITTNVCVICDECHMRRRIHVCGSTFFHYWIFVSCIAVHVLFSELALTAD